MEEVIYQYQHQTWHLSAHRAIFWKEEQALIVSDLHLGKSTHFRKAGIAVPANIGQDDLYRLQQLITLYNPVQVIIVGDMFHSKENNDVTYFKIWRQQFAHISFKLIKGNHDILSDQLYEAMNLEVYNTYSIKEIRFAHEPCHDESGYTFSGHLHPGFAMAGAGRQHLRLPCFYFGKSCSILPAFGKFTGLAMLQPEEDEAVFVIAENTVLKVN